MNFLDKIGEKILDCVLAAIFDWVLAALGCVLAALGCYLIRYKSNVDNLETQVEELRGARDRLQHEVDTARRNLMKIEDNVKRRLTESDDIIAVAEKFLKDEVDTARRNLMKIEDNVKRRLTESDEDDKKGWYLNMMSRYQVSKRADKAASEAKNLKDEISKINSVGYLESTKVVETVTSNRGYKAFESRMPTITGLLEALKDHNITRIGVYGMGGIGKTMLVKEVLKQAVRDKLFNKYLFVVVSNPPDLKKIQREIAEKLGLKLEGEITESALADRLCEQLKQKNGVLIILDDIWKYLDLEALGIFFGDDQKGCKLLLTSRLQSTLRDMDTKMLFPVGVLSDNEPISLFEKIVGDLAGEFKSIMPQIVKECAGLPIAITTVANALKNRKNIGVWKYALNQLKKSRPIEIVGTDEKAVYESIKLSYEFLPDEEKSLLLLCSLHGEDYDIMIEDLLKYAVGWDLLKNDHKIEDARSTVHKSVEGLKDTCLLLDGKNNGTVKMHDVIRDFVINIAAEERHMFTIRTVDELQTRSKRKDTVAISLPYINDDLDLPNQFECSKLELLLLFYQRVDFRIPDSFFEGLKDLKVLKLSRISWSKEFRLPSSLSSLENLQTLCLDGNKVQNAIIIGELKNLKALSLSLSNTERLPKEIGQLTHLQLLDLGKCSQLKFIPPNVLSNLKMLEELYLPDNVEWEVEAQSTERINAMVSELDHLSHLTKLHICIKNAKILPKAMVFERLESYRIAIGSAWLWEETSETSRILKLNIILESDNGYKVLLRKCESLFLGKMKGVKNILYELDSEGFPCLKHLKVENNDEIQYIIKSMGVRGTVFPILESIKLLYVNNLERISYTQLPTESFCNLRMVKVSNCCQLEFVFSSSMVGCFSHLQEMNIEDCERMSAIVVIEKEEEIEVNSDDNIVFANLQSLRLRNLLKLKGFLSVDSLVLFNGKVVFPNLLELEIECMDSMKMIWPDQLILDSFCKLENLTVSNFTNLTNIVPPNMLRTLRNLKELKIERCGSIEEVFDVQGTNNVEESRDIAATELIYLTLRNLEKVKHVWSMDPQGIITFGKLRTIKIEGCSSLKSVFPTSVAKDLMQLEMLVIKNCATVEEIVAKEEGIETTTLVVFPQLFSLNLVSLPELKSFYPGKHTSEWPLLNQLIIKKCDKLKIFGSNKESVEETNGLGHDVGVIQDLFLFSEKGKFPNLEYLELDEGNAMNETCGETSAEFCCNLKEITLHGNSDKWSMFPNVEAPIATAGVSDFRRLKNIVPFSSTSFHYLQNLDILGSDVLVSLLTPSTARTLGQLQLIRIENCERMTEIVANEGSEAEAGDEIAFNNLRYLGLIDLPSLTAFHLGNRTIKFPSLVEVNMYSCPKLKIFCSGVLSTPKLTCISIEEITEEEGDGDLDLNATIKEYWEAKLETCDQKFAEKTGAGEVGESEHDDQKFVEKLRKASQSLPESSSIAAEGSLPTTQGSLPESSLTAAEGSLPTTQVSLPESTSAAAECSLAKTQDSAESSSPMTKTPKISDETDVLTNHPSDQDGAQDVFSFQRMKVSEISQLLELPKNLHSLKIEGCDVLENIPEEVIASIPFLQRLYIISCCSLKSFPEPIALKILHIQNCKKLEFPPPARKTNQYALLEHLCIGNSCDSLTFVQLNLFPKLRCLSIWDCKNLESFSTLEGNQKDLTSLEALEIRDCPNLKYFPKGGLPTPNLKSIWLSKCENLKELPHQLDTLNSLLSIFINNCPELVSLPQGGLPSNLSLLCITSCDKLTLMRDWGLLRLDCLIKLEIEGGCETVKSFPEEKLLPSNLNSLRVSRLLNLQHLDYKGLQHLTALKTLEISCCDKLESLPEEGLPSSLSVLCIKQCSLLKPKLRKHTGDYWPKIAHISFIETDEEVIS